MQEPQPSKERPPLRLTFGSRADADEWIDHINEVLAEVDRREIRANQVVPFDPAWDWRR